MRADALTAVLEGRLPDGSRLGKEINGNHVHRPGHDLTFSAPKSVSILALIGEDKAMLDAHNRAVRVAAGYVEKLISARDTKDGVTSIVHTARWWRPPSLTIHHVTSIAAAHPPACGQYDGAVRQMESAGH
ncbi:Multifunctional conjugation protein TraI [Citrobacter amalonaticus]|nr:Multifunctional conjugation protein TraI [Citrobacter amalonaticus]